MSSEAADRQGSHCSHHNPRRSGYLTRGLPGSSTCLAHSQLTSTVPTLRRALSTLQDHPMWTDTQKSSLFKEACQLLMMCYEKAEDVVVLDTVSQAILDLTNKREDTGEVSRLWNAVVGSYPTLQSMWCNEVKR